MILVLQILKLGGKSSTFSFVQLLLLYFGSDINNYMLLNEILKISGWYRLFLTSKFQARQFAFGCAQI